MAAVSLVDKNISQFGHFKSQRQIYLLNKLELTQCNGEGEGLELTGDQTFFFFKGGRGERNIEG